MHLKKKTCLDVLHQTFDFCSLMLYKLWRRTQRVWENIVFIRLVNANDLYLKQHPSVGGLFPFHSVKFLSIMQCYRGGRLREKKNKPRICKHSSSFLASRKSAHRPLNTRRLVGLWIGDWNLIIFYYNPNNCPLNRELSIKKNAFQKSSGFIVLEHKWIMSVEREKRFRLEGFFLCYVKQRNTQSTLRSTLPHAALQKD